MPENVDSHTEQTIRKIWGDRKVVLLAQQELASKPKVRIRPILRASVISLNAARRNSNSIVENLLDLVRGW